MFMRTVVLGLLVTASGLFGCSVKEPCDEGQAVFENLCVDVPSGGASGDGGPSFDAACKVHEDCTGGTLCGAEEGFPICVGLCGPGDAFENNCPEGRRCFEAQTDIFACVPE